MKILEYLRKNKIKKSNAKILVLGLSYKPNIDDLRESSSVFLLKELLNINIKNIQWCDPHIKQKISIIKFNYNKKGININSKILNFFDTVVLMTDHDKFDYDLIYKNSKAIIDCRGRYAVDDKVIRA